MTGEVDDDGVMIGWLTFVLCVSRSLSFLRANY